MVKPLLGPAVLCASISDYFAVELTSILGLWSPQLDRAVPGIYVITVPLVPKHVSRLPGAVLKGAHGICANVTDDTDANADKTINSPVRRKFIIVSIGSSTYEHEAKMSVVRRQLCFLWFVRGYLMERSANGKQPCIKAFLSAGSARGEATGKTIWP